MDFTGDRERRSCGRCGALADTVSSGIVPRTAPTLNLRMHSLGVLPRSSRQQTRQHEYSEAREHSVSRRCRCPFKSNYYSRLFRVSIVFPVRRGFVSCLGIISCIHIRKSIHLLNEAHLDSRNPPRDCSRRNSWAIRCSFFVNILRTPTEPSIT